MAAAGPWQGETEEEILETLREAPRARQQRRSTRDAVNWLLDTNIFIPALNGRPSVPTRLNEAEATGEVVTSVLVLGELLYSAKCSKRSTENIRAVEKQLANIKILPVTTDVTRLFSDLKAARRRRGIVKSDVDLLIATTALDHGAGTEPPTANALLPYRANPSYESTPLTGKWWGRSPNCQRPPRGRAVSGRVR